MNKVTSYKTWKYEKKMFKGSTTYSVTFHEHKGPIGQAQQAVWNMNSIPSVDNFQASRKTPVQSF